MAAIFKITRICLLISVVMLTSCTLFNGSDGDDGSIHLAIDWIEQPVYYTDTNPAIPQGFVRNRFYQSLPGTYSFTYAFDDEFGWEGFYQLKEAEPGEAGKLLWKDGKDGMSAFYTLLLTYRGTDLDNYYEKQLPDDGVDFTQIIEGAFIITIHKRRVQLTSPYDINANKLSGE